MKQEKKTYIIEGLPTLLGKFPFPQFQTNWNQSRELPPLKRNFQTKECNVFDFGNMPQEVDSCQASFLLASRSETKIPTQVEEDYNLQEQFYQLFEGSRKQKIAKCGHSDRLVFIKNMCYSCYQFTRNSIFKRKQKLLK